MTDPCLNTENKLLTLKKALQNIASHISPITGTEHIDLKNALGRILAQTLYAQIPLPPADVSAMDGYAFSSTDLIPDAATTLKLAGISWAGKPFLHTLKPGECVRIFTGAVIPDGADSVIMQEQVTSNEKDILLPAACAVNRFIRKAGSDIAPGQLLLKHFKQITAQDCGLLAANGFYSAPVLRKLRIAFLSTGDELKSPGQTLGDGDIYNSNRYALHGLLNKAAYSVTDLGSLPDNKERLQHALQQAAREFDVLISTGGASVGDADFIAEILAESGQVNFWKLAIKPGKPLAFGRFSDCWFFGLPGNPVSAIVTFQKIIQPALDQLMGLPASQPLQLSALAEQDLPKMPGRMEFQRGIFTQQAGKLLVKPADGQDSHQLTALSRANCYIVFDADSHGAKAGEIVTIEPFSVNTDVTQ